MAAPAAPTIFLRFDGAKARVRWLPVADATDYKLYAGVTASPTGLEADVPDEDIKLDGWFSYTFVPDELPLFVAVTALNLAAEESGLSNERTVQSYGSSSSFPGDYPHIPRRSGFPFG